MERLLSVLRIFATMNLQLGSLLCQGSWKSSRIAELLFGIEGADENENEEDSYKGSWKFAGFVTLCVPLSHSIDLWQGGV